MSYKSLFAVTCLAGIASAQATTIATFADPALNGSTPMFTAVPSSLQLSGSWTGNGLNLQMPGLGGGTVSNAHMSMAPVSYTTIVPNIEALGAGVVHFTDSSNNALLDVSFSSGLLTLGGVSALSLVGNNVHFSGPATAGYSFSNESFSFAWANIGVDDSGNVTATSSFTSSANVEVVPEPASMVAIGAGLLGLARKRRNK